MAKAIMIQGTMSNAGKSLIAAGLCRIFHQDGYRVAPFKSQNMALNSFITEEGLEMGRAQVVQAEAAGIRPSVLMNPILLKPTTDMGSQVIILGKSIGHMEAREYFRRKKEYIPVIREAYQTLAENHDIIVIEGAGSPAEINLRQDDIVNMGMARIADAPVLLVGDIDRGGVFAQLAGTVMLLEKEEQERIAGLIINKFRGDRSILESGLESLEKLTGKPVLGVVPYADIYLEDEDSLSSELLKTGRKAPLDLAVIRFPKISNFTDFQIFDAEPSVSVRYVERPSKLGNPDMVILPGTKSTMADLLWLRESGLEAAVLKLSAKGVPVLGICGGFQMLGERIEDPCRAEMTEELSRKSGFTGPDGSVRGMGLLPAATVFEREKTMVQKTAEVPDIGLPSLLGARVTGYEVHMGRTCLLSDTRTPVSYASSGNVYGTYLHGIFDEGDFRGRVLKLLAERKGIPETEMSGISMREFKEQQMDRLADLLRENLDMDAVRRLVLP